MTNMLGKIQGLHKKAVAERERTVESVKKEDFLVKQIDEFKTKAQHLQQLLDMKENRVQELQKIVEEREQKARTLQELLKIKQQEADKITESVEEYVKQISEELVGKTDAGNEELLKNLNGFREEVSAKLDTMKGELSEKIHTESVKNYRNMQSLIEEKEQNQEESPLGRSIGSMKGYLRVMIVFSVINFLVLAGIFVYELEIWRYFIR